WHLAPRAVGPAPIRALNVQAMELQVHTERVELAPTYGCVIELEVESKDELLRRIRESRSKLERIISPLDESRMTTPGPDGWSVKDHRAHVAAWEESLLALLEGRDRDAAVGLDTVAAEQARDVDAINAAIQRRSREQALADVRSTFDATHARLLATLE